MNRRRFLCLSAAMTCAPTLAVARTWSGIALGARARVQLQGPRDLVAQALHAIPTRLDQIEGLFSLYRADSALSRLNAKGQLIADPLFLDLCARVDEAHALTNGLFDPTVQPLWRAMAEGHDPDAVRAAIGWQRVQRAEREITLDREQALTFNGIAQGFATDLIRADLERLGFTHALIDVSEHSALGGPFHLSLTDPIHGPMGQLSLSNLSRATSSPDALRLGRQSHILSPQRHPPLWSTVSIEAESAALADALSTAAVFMSHDRLRRLKSDAQLSRITTVDAHGNLRTL